MQRLLPPIYDAIDSQQYTLAIRLSLNKKISHIPLVQVLRAHCLERLDKVSEALKLCRDVQKHKPTDELTVNTMHLVFRMCEQELEMIPTLQDACTATPTSEELHLKLFSAYVREGSLVKQQQIAMKLYKLQDGMNAKYICYACTSMLLQVQIEKASDKVAALAERMLAKAFEKLDDSKLTGEMVVLFLTILCHQKKQNIALKALNDLTVRMKDHSRVAPRQDEDLDDSDVKLGPLPFVEQLKWKVSLSKESEQWDVCVDACEELLIKYCADDYAILQDFLVAKFERCLKNVSDFYKSICGFLSTLGGDGKSDKLRGPRLAQIDGAALVLARAQDEDTVVFYCAEFNRLLLEYIAVFFAKPCCFSDIRKHLAIYGNRTFSTSFAARFDVSRQLFLAEISKFAKRPCQATSNEFLESDASKEAAIASLNRYLLQQKIFIHMGHHDAFSKEELQATAEEYVRHYVSLKQISAKAEGGQREVQYTDDLILLAAHTLLHMFTHFGSATVPSEPYNLLVEIAALLEYGLENSAYNFQMKLLLCHVYAQLGAGQAMLERYRELDVKYIQLDSLSYLVQDKLIQMSHVNDSQQLCKRILHLHQTSEKDVPKYISRAFDLGNYSKVLDITTFQTNKMRRSYTKAKSQCEWLYFQLIEAADESCTALCDFMTCSVLQENIERLQKYMDESTPISFNQHRDIMTQFSTRLLFLPVDFPADQAYSLVDCDRSANESTAPIWLQLDLFVADMLRGLAVSEMPMVSEEFVNEYKKYLQALGLWSTNSAAPLVQTLWTLSYEFFRCASGSAESMQPEDLQSAWKLFGEQLASAIVEKCSTGAIFLYELSLAAQVLQAPGLWLYSTAVILLTRQRNHPSDNQSCPIGPEKLLLSVQKVYKALADCLLVCHFVFNGQKPCVGTLNLQIEKCVPNYKTLRDSVTAKIAKSHAQIHTQLHTSLENRLGCIRSLVSPDTK